MEISEIGAQNSMIAELNSALIPPASPFECHSDRGLQPERRDLLFARPAHSLVKTPKTRIYLTYVFKRGKLFRISDRIVVRAESVGRSRLILGAIFQVQYVAAP